MKIMRNKPKLPGLLLGVLETGKLEHRVMRLLDEGMPWARRGRVASAVVWVLVLGAASMGVGALGVRAQSASAESLPAFGAETIKLPGPGDPGISGFVGYPGGRVFFGGSVKMLMYYVFELPESRIADGPDWAAKERYVINAVPPESSPSRTAKQPPIKATPSEEQRQMLMNLLLTRFGLRYHKQTVEGPVYILSRGSKPLKLEPPKDSAADSRGGITVKSTGIDGEATGINMTMAFLAKQLSSSLHRPVLDQTGLTGSYDFHLEPDNPDNHDMAEAVFDAMDRLGLKLKEGKGPVETIVIDHVDQPTEN